jgi:hypothetical protein
MKRASAILAVLAALAWAGAALASYSSPKIVASPPAGGSQTFELSQDPSDDATAKLAVYAQSNGVTLPGGAVGTQIGTVDATLVLIQAGGASVSAAGKVLVADASAYASPAKSCTGAAGHDAVWLLRLTASGQTLDVPVYVDRAAGSATSYATAVLQVCLAPPDVPASMGGAPLGAKLVRAKITIQGVFGPSPSSAAYRWTSVWTPWYPVIGLVDTSDAVEAQSIVQPGKVTIVAKRIVRKAGRKKLYFAKVSGSVTSAGDLLSGARVDIGEYDAKTKKAKRHLVYATTRNGSYAATIRLTHTTLFGAAVSAAPGNVSPPVCIPDLPNGLVALPCASVTTSGFDAVKIGARLGLPKR